MLAKLPLHEQNVGLYVSALFRAYSHSGCKTGPFRLWLVIFAGLRQPAKP
jgi:hypothetical protein